MDGAILFSDILIVPMALGQDLWFETGEGPRLAPTITTRDVLEGLQMNAGALEPVYGTVRKVAALLPPDDQFPRLCRQSLDDRDLYDRRAG
jgi:uroporphyrinogen decarboxylase